MRSSAADGQVFWSNFVRALFIPMQLQFTLAYVKQGWALRWGLLRAAVLIGVWIPPAQTVASDPPAGQFTYDPVAHAYFVTGESYFNHSFLGADDVLIGKDNATSFQTVPGQFTVTFGPDMVNFAGSGTYVYPDGKTYNNVHVFGAHVLRTLGTFPRASVSYLSLHDTSVGQFEGGRVEYDLSVSDYARLNFSAGFARNISTYDHAETNFTGGTGHVSGYHNSVTNITGGSPGNISFSGSSTGNYHGGQATGTAFIGDNSRFRFDGGSISNIKTFSQSISEIAGGDVFEIDLFDQSVVNTSVGIAGGVVSWDNSTLNLSAGIVGYVTLIDDATLNLSGGRTRISSQGGNVNMTGGEITQYLYSFGDSVVNLRGGTIAGATVFEIGNGAAINFYGQALSFSNAQAGAETFMNTPGVFYDLQWTREDGEVINSRFFDSYGDVNAAVPQGVLLVTVPEPATASLVLIIAIALGSGRYPYGRRASSGR